MDVCNRFAKVELMMEQFLQSLVNTKMDEVRSDFIIVHIHVKKTLI